MRRALPACVVLACLLPLISCAKVPPSSTDDNVFLQAPEFTLTERSGRTVRKADLLGKVWIASFVFTRCTGPCPQVSATMAQLQKELAGQPDVVLVTFTVDPERDTPKELTEYAAHFGADPERWLFLTGKADEIYHLVNKGFLLAAQPNQGTARQPGAEVEHSTRLVVVDRHGFIRGYFQGVRDTRQEDPEPIFQMNLARLKRKLDSLIQEKP
jgi:cytochrome oxidase Cu insertion factor (SCO1/SenC/PrrC family)